MYTALALSFRGPTIYERPIGIISEKFDRMYNKLGIISKKFDQMYNNLSIISEKFDQM